MIGVAALGVELRNPVLGTTFYKCYNQIFDGPALGNVITLINSYVPIRWLLPIEANRGFVRATTEIRRLIRGFVQQRIRQLSVDRKDGNHEDDKDNISRDLLTYMIEERLLTNSGWTEDDIVEHVCSLPRTSGIMAANEVLQLVTFVAAGIMIL